MSPLQLLQLRHLHVGRAVNFTDCIGHCGRGCLYNLSEDEEERDDLAARYPQRVSAMLKRLDDYHRTAFLPERCVKSAHCQDPITCTGRGGGCHHPAACEAAVEKWDGFWGPFLP